MSGREIRGRRHDRSRMSLRSSGLRLLHGLLCRKCSPQGQGYAVTCFCAPVARFNPFQAPHLHAQYRAMSVDLRAAADEVAAVHAPSDRKDSPLFIPDSPQAWVRLALALVIGSLGGGRLGGGGGGLS